MNTQARVVIVGGGIMGASLLYHLGLEGCSDAILVEKDELTSGSTWHAAGQCPSITGSYNLAKIHAYGNTLYPKLEALTGQYVSWHASGGLRLASNATELAWLKYVEGYAKSIGFRMQLIGPDEIRRLNPFLTLDRVLAGAWTLDDGHGDPSGICNAFAKGARQLGAVIQRHNRVLDIRARANGEWEVVTEQGSIVAEMVVNAAGCYARQVAAMVGADAPITNMQHHYLITHPIPAFMDRSEEIPVTRDSYASGYLRQEQKSGLIGIYESTGMTQAWAPVGHPQWESSNELFPDDLDRIAPWLERAIERMPIFGEAGIRRVINGAIPHTPDGPPLLGPAANLRNFWLCCGSSFGIAQGAGCGKYLAQWMLHGDAEINMTEFDPRRFGPFADAAYVHAKSFQDYQLTFTTRPPGSEEMAGRPRRVSPLYHRLKDAGAQYAETFGWERPKWFSHSHGARAFDYVRNEVFEVIRAEVMAVHERVGVLDLSGFAKYEVSGSDAAAFLERLSANTMPARTGRIGLVHFLSAQGRIASEMTVTRLADDRFYLLAAAAAELRDLDLLRQGVAPREAVRIHNVTDDFGVLVVSGPRSRELLSALTTADLSNAAFPWLSARSIEVAGIAVHALRVSYVGELGWELHAPMHSLSALYEAVWKAGAPYGIANYGLYAVNSMRIEKGYKAWSAELTNELDLLEADMPRFIKFDKPDFVGKTATQQRSASSLRIVCLDVAESAAGAPKADARGGEPVLLSDRCIGVTTSGAYGHRVNKSLAFACVDSSAITDDAGLTVRIQAETRPARVLAAPPFDPDNSRMRV